MTHVVAECVLATAVVAGVTACTLGDGEGPRYTARVTRVSAQEICVGPNESSRVDTCGKVPAGFTELPHIGACMSLFGHPNDDGQTRTWTETSLRLKVDDSECH